MIRSYIIGFGKLLGQGIIVFYISGVILHYVDALRSYSKDHAWWVTLLANNSPTIGASMLWPLDHISYTAHKNRSNKSNDSSFVFQPKGCPFSVTFPFKPEITMVTLQDSKGSLTKYPMAIAIDPHTRFRYHSECIPYKGKELRKFDKKTYVSFMLDMAKKTYPKSANCKASMLEEQNKRPYVKYQCSLNLTSDGVTQSLIIDNELHDGGTSFLLIRVAVLEKVYPHDKASLFMDSVR